MLPPLIRRRPRNADTRERERGVTMALVAVSMVAIISMAAISIDLGSLYEARAEAQRAADLAALAGARVISVSGTTTDPANGGTDGAWTAICNSATAIANAVGKQNSVGGSAASTVSVSFGTAGSPGSGCTGAAFGVNPVVTVTVKQASLPTFFARVFALVKGTTSNSGVSATASAEVFNSSDSANFASNMIPVQPRCVKPWIIPNYDNVTGGTFVNAASGNITDPGVYDNVNPGSGIIGQKFDIGADCGSTGANCEPGVYEGMTTDPPRYGNDPLGPTPGKKIVQYIPAYVQNASAAVPACASDLYQQAIAGCDQSTVYSCGTPSTTAGATQADLTFNPGVDSAFASQCLINQTVGSENVGNDQIIPTGTLTNPPFPFQITAGDDNPLVKAGSAASGDVITSSGSIVTLPIADYAGVAFPAGSTQPTVTIVGFLQVFINYVYVGQPGVAADGDMNVTVLNVVGCGNNAAGNPSVTGTSPVPIRLITPP